ncbi:chromate efflux transporter [Haloferula chungangensis]|uniref:Chromate efflux transporter n=1 Tax=Haloferula chungangensis TaxID=1048331 RepID=A0ABW2L9X2_9BACT
MPPDFRTALRFWWKLGWISFGGPAGQIAIMHKELVEEKRWLSDEHFLHALNFTMLLPGPEAQQLATYLGWRLHGAKGGIAAGVLFVLPSVLILFALSWLYMAGGHLGWIAGIFHGLVPAVIAIVFSAAKRIGGKALKTPALWVIAILSLITIRFLGIPFPIIIIAAALIGWFSSRRFPKQFPAGKGHGAIADTEPAMALPPAPRASLPRSLKIITTCLSLWWLPVVATGLLLGWKSVHAQEGIFFSKAALITFGGAYAVLPYVAQQAVETHGWLSQTQMIAGLGLAETTPGPLIMVLQFVGFVGAWQHPGEFTPLASAALGAGITTWVTFLPCFLFVFLGAPHVEGLGEKPALSATLNAITAAVVGVILNLALWFTWHAVQPEAGRIDYFVIVLAIAAWLAIEKMKLGVLPLLGVCAALGLAYSFL